MQPIEAALESLKSLKSGESPNYTATAKKFGCNRSTLSRRHRSVQGTKAEQYENQRNLTEEQSRVLIDYINKLAARGLPPSNEMLRNFAKEIRRSEDKPGRKWAQRWRERYSKEIVYAYGSGIDRGRKSADSAFKYALYFELMQRKIQQYEVEAAHMYNMDEKGFLLGMLQKGKRYFSRRKYEETGLKQRLQDGNREWITSIGAICADGTALSPTLIYQAVSGNVQDTWLQDYDPQEQKCYFTSSQSGWTNDKIGYTWLVNTFDRETKAKARRKYRLLILDGHGSHVTMKFIEYCDANRILLAIFPPHSTHTLQPLDVSLFSPLATAYSDEIEKFLHDCQGFCKLSKRASFVCFG